MGSKNVEQLISDFLRRKESEAYERATAGRRGSRTVKYATRMRTGGNLLITR